MNSKNNSLSFDSIIFDVDGTFWDSTAIVADAWSDYLKNEEHMDIPITAELLMGLFGRTLPDIAAVILKDCSKEEQLRIITACNHAEHAAIRERGGAPMYEGLEQMLRILSRHYPLFIVSNCEAGYIELFLECTGFSKYFRGHLCPGDTGNAKAENISQIVKDNRLKHPVYVGDTMGDFQASEKAGVPFIFASYGFGDVASPYAVISAPMDLVNLLLG